MIRSEARNKAIFGMRYLSRSFSEEYQLADMPQTTQTNKKSPRFLSRVIFYVEFLCSFVSHLSKSSIATDKHGGVSSSLIFRDIRFPSLLKVAIVNSSPPMVTELPNGSVAASIKTSHMSIPPNNMTANTVVHNIL